MIQLPTGQRFASCPFLANPESQSPIPFCPSPALALAPHNALRMAGKCELYSGPMSEYIQPYDFRDASSAGGRHAFRGLEGRGLASGGLGLGAGQCGGGRA